MARAFLAAALLLPWVSLCRPACGFGGDVFRLPGESPGRVAAYSRRHGLAITLDTRWFDNAGGYRPVTVEVDAKNAASRDRQVTVELSALDRNLNSTQGPAALRVRGELLLPAGETRGRITLPCPSLANWSFVWWETRVDGKAAPSLSLPRANAYGLRGSGQRATLRVYAPSIADSDDLRDDREGQLKLYRGLNRLMIDDARGKPLEDWLAYSTADVVSLNLADLRQLADARPERLAAIRRFVLSGGTLWVQQSGVSPERLASIERSLGVSDWRLEAAPDGRPEAPDTTVGQPSGVDEATDAPAARQTIERRRPVDGAPGWSYPVLADDEQRQEQVEAVIERAKDGDTAGALRRLFGGGAPDTRGWYAQLDVGFGRVMAFRGKPFETPIALALGGVDAAVNAWASRGWAPRHGLQPGGASPSYGNLLVPGVGVAPVLEFQVLITLFVLVIGPLNYWLLWRRRQLQLMVVTTPLAAALATLGLVVYAAVADGFGVKARARSVTLLNQAAGEAVTWSRVSHYAAVAPEQPAALPGDAAVYPIEPAWEAAIAARPTNRAMAWSEGGQTLLSGWLPARTAAQHLVVRCGRTDARIDFAGEPAGSVVKNRLGGDIELLLVIDSSGRWRRGEGLVAGSTGRLEPVERLDAIQAIRELAIANQPAFPVGAGRAVEETLQRLGAARDVRRIERDLASYSLGDNLMNQRLDALTGLDGGVGLDLPPRSFIAVTSTATETPLGWEEVEEVDSFHVVAGRW